MLRCFLTWVSSWVCLCGARVRATISLPSSGCIFHFWSVSITIEQDICCSFGLFSLLFLLSSSALLLVTFDCVEHADRHTTTTKNHKHRPNHDRGGKNKILWKITLTLSYGVKNKSQSVWWWIPLTRNFRVAGTSRGAFLPIMSSSWRKYKKT